MIEHLSTDRRGQFVQRVQRSTGHPFGRLHLVDSTINDDAITYCGDSLPLGNRHGRLTYFADAQGARQLFGEAIELCRMCDRAAYVR
jgi:hypothetical protein